MPKNPDPSIKLTSSKGQTRTLDDWSTMFHLTLVILPPRPEAARYIPIAERIAVLPPVAAQHDRGFLRNVQPNAVRAGGGH